MTGIPALRAYALGLPAPGLFRTLMHYSNYSIASLLKDLQLWISASEVDRRDELLMLAAELQEKLVERITARCNAHQEDLVREIANVLQGSVVEASEYAVKQLDKKRNKHAATIRAFIRRNGNHATRLCPREVWNENFSKLFNDLAVKQESTVAQLKEERTDELESGIKQDLEDFIKKLDTFPSSLPKERLVEAINIQVRGIENAFALAHVDNVKDVR